MINSIIAGISNALYQEFGYENHMEEIKQGLKAPCFFISCIKPTLQRYPGKRYFRENSFVIQYFPKAEMDYQKECSSVADRMFFCLEAIQTNEGSIRGTKMSYQVIDGVLNFFVNYDCFMRKVEQLTTMGEMKNHINTKG